MLSKEHFKNTLIKLKQKHYKGGKIIMKTEIQRAQTVCELIKETNGLKSKKFNKDKKIEFAYKYWNLSFEDITELYDHLAEIYSTESAKLARTIGAFIDNQGITNIRRFNVSFFDQKLETIQNTTAKIRANGNWLSLYDIEREFAKQSTHQNPIRYSCLTQDGNIFRIDRDRANEILGILIDENIPTAKCIVTSSFPYYARNDMDTYIKSFQKRK